ncbi:MAG: hypothetical protein V4560_18070 [Bacteroidota bacterium]
MIRQLLKSLFITIILTTVFTTGFCQFAYKIHKDLLIKGKVDSCITNYTTVYYKDSVEIKQLVSKTIEYFDKHGKIVKFNTYVFSNNSDTVDVMKHPLITAYSYDKKGNIAEVVNYNSAGVDSKDVFIYTGNKSLVSINNYSLPDNKLQRVTKMKLNAIGDIEEYDYYVDTVYSAKPFTKINFEYNAKGYLIKYSSSYSYTSKTRQTYCTYDPDDNLVQFRAEQSGSEPTIQDYNYPKFDKLHNWLLRNTYDKGKLRQSMERSITYYK